MSEAKKFIGEYPLIEKEWLNTSYYRLRFCAPEIAVHGTPGQFVNFKYSHSYEPLLRRPMSIFRRHRKEGWLEFLIKIVGMGTLLFSRVNPGDHFSLLGPLGRGFDFHDVKQAILVAGGIGVAPLVFLAEEMSRTGLKPLFILGFQNKDELCCLSQLKPFVSELLVTTEDGSYGDQGLVTDRFSLLLRDRPELKHSTVFACGSNPMLFALEQLCTLHEIQAQFSLEAHMACGIGACVGCAVPARDHQTYYLACEDGPVFKKGEVDLGA